MHTPRVTDSTVAPMMEQTELCEIRADWKNLKSMTSAETQNECVCMSVHKHCSLIDRILSKNNLCVHFRRAVYNIFLTCFKNLKTERNGMWKE